MMIWNLTV